jgi:hypothetical protein
VTVNSHIQVLNILKESLEKNLSIIQPKNQPYSYICSFNRVILHSKMIISLQDQISTSKISIKMKMEETLLIKYVTANLE